MNKPLVSISCTTFNHEDYIKQCLDGFLMQRCNFDYEILIHDDASTDETAKIIKEYEIKYPNLIKPIYQKENQYSQGVRGMMSRFNFPRAQGKYIALCEGDDYWTDPYKLQKQVDFLEKNEEYGLVSTQRNNYNENLKKITRPRPIDKDSTYTFNDVLFGVPIATLTTVFRKKYILELIEINKKNNFNLSFFDYTLWLYISFYSKVMVLKDVTAVYRILENSISHQKDLWLLKRNYFYDFLILIEYFNISKTKIIKRALYYRAKYSFLIAINDDIASKKIYDILKDNKDYIRIFIQKLCLKFPFLIPLFKKIDKIVFIL